MFHLFIYLYGRETIPHISPSTKRMWTKDSSIQIPDLWTGLKVWFGAITMTLITIDIGVLGKTIFKCVFYLSTRQEKEKLSKVRN